VAEIWAMLFKEDIVRRIAAGEVTLAFRRWKKPAAVTGGQQVTSAGLVGFVSVEPVDPDAIADADAQAAGYADRTALMRSVEGREGTIYRTHLRPLGADPRIALREQAELDETSRADLAARLDRMGAWTRETLALIRDNPGLRAGHLAARLGRDMLPFKRDVRKLKALGLTESLEVGYRLSPRGAALLHEAE
jgi:hypothetical protein